MAIKRTQIAQQAFDFAGYFAATFGSYRIGGASPRRPLLVAPQDMSTAGGKKAKQHIILQPDNPAFAVLTVGWIDLASGAICLRTYGCLQQMHQQRFGSQALDLDPGTYQSFMDQAQQFFSRQGMRVEIEAQSALPARASPKASSSKNLVLAIVAVLAGLGIFAVGVVGYLYIHFFR